MLLEGSRTTAIRLLDVWDDKEYVYLKIQDLQNGKINDLSWSLDYEGEYWLWSLTSYNYMMEVEKMSGVPC